MPIWKDGTRAIVLAIASGVLVEHGLEARAPPPSPTTPAPRGQLALDFG